MRRNWDGKMILDIEDVEELPNGTASVFRVGNDEGGEVLATIDENGRLTGLDGKPGGFCTDTWGVVGPVNSV